MIDPQDIANRITEDPDIIREELYGQRVAHGTSQVDQLVRWVEANYKDWDIEDSEFQIAFYQIFRAPTNVGASMMVDILKIALERRSMQTDILKKKLIKMMQSQLPNASHQSTIPKQGRIHMKNGTIINAQVIIDGARASILNSNMLWVGTGGAATGHRLESKRHQSKYRKRKINLKELYAYDGYKQDHKVLMVPNWKQRGFVQPPIHMTDRGYYFHHRYNKILTVNKTNVAKID